MGVNNECRQTIEFLVGALFPEKTMQLDATDVGTEVCALVSELKARVAALEQRLTVKSDRVALLESEMQIPNAEKYKTAIEEAFDACSIAIDGDTGWEYPGQMVRAVESVVRERGEALDSVSKLEAAIRGLVVDVCDEDGPAYRACSACTAMDVPYPFVHDEDCPAKPALDLVFGTDADHARGGR